MGQNSSTVHTEADNLSGKAPSSSAPSNLGVEDNVVWLYKIKADDWEPFDNSVGRVVEMAWQSWQTGAGPASVQVAAAQSPSSNIQDLCECP